MAKELTMRNGDVRDADGVVCFGCQSPTDRAIQYRGEFWCRECYVAEQERGAE